MNSNTPRLHAALALLCMLGCSEDTTQPLSREQLLDPESCKDCHPKHYTEWSASMHAYALEDPVFVAMNARGQEETSGELGDFCVNCHAPMAVREGAFVDGDFANLEQVPDHLQGVTCYFCHNTVDVERDHNNGLVLADDQTMRGGIRDPLQPTAHRAEYSERHDRSSAKSSQTCGACHDIVTPAGVHLERTYAEYKTTVFAEEGSAFQSCQDCHMDSSDLKEVVADYPGVKARTRHSHLFPGVDVPLTEFPGREAMVSAVERFALPQSIGYFAIEPDGNPTEFAFTATFETQAGHGQSSGATQDRRLWLEVRAFNEDGSVRFESGVIGDDQIEEVAPGAAGHDSELCLLRERMFDKEDPMDPDAKEVHMFWEARSTTSFLMPPPTSFVTGAHAQSCRFSLRNAPAPAPLGPGSPPARMTIRMRMRPMGFDVLNDLVESGHLAAGIPKQMPTFTFYEVDVTWTDEGDPFSFEISENKVPYDENAYLCLLHGDEYCD